MGLTVVNWLPSHRQRTTPRAHGDDFSASRRYRYRAVSLPLYSIRAYRQHTANRTAKRLLAARRHLPDLRRIFLSLLATQSDSCARAGEVRRDDTRASPLFKAVQRGRARPPNFQPRQRDDESRDEAASVDSSEPPVSRRVVVLSRSVVAPLQRASKATQTASPW